VLRADAGAQIVVRRALFAACWLLLAAGCVGTGTPERGTSEERLRAHLDLATGYYEIGDLNRAKMPLEYALQIDRTSWEAHDLLGRIYQQEGELALAEKAFRQAVRSAPDNARVRNDYGVFLYQRGRYADAVDELRLAVRDPDNPRRSVAYENLGLASLQIGDRDLARASFERAVILDRQLVVSLLELAHLSFQDGEFDEAAAYYERYRSNARQSPRSLWLGIQLARVAGDSNAIASYALQLRNLYPYSDEYRLYRESVADG
jgi:type IV pilus assembly protein PilF